MTVLRSLLKCLSLRARLGYPRVRLNHPKGGVSNSAHYLQENGQRFNLVPGSWLSKWNREVFIKAWLRLKRALSSQLIAFSQEARHCLIQSVVLIRHCITHRIAFHCDALVKQVLIFLCPFMLTGANRWCVTVLFDHKQWCLLIFIHTGTIAASRLVNNHRNAYYIWC